MKNPKKVIFFFFFSTLFLFTGGFLPADELWDKASEFYSGADEWSPEHMFLESVELDKKGNVKELWEYEYEHPAGGNEEEWEIVSVLKDGRPATDKEIEKRERRAEKGPPDDGYFNGVNILCLGSSEKDRITCENTGRNTFLNGETYHVYTFVHTYDSGAETAGEVFIAPDGFPGKLEYEFTNLPFYMKTMKSRITFSRRGNAAVIETMNMEGHVSLVLFNFRFRTKMFFTEYFQNRA